VILVIGVVALFAYESLVTSTSTTSSPWLQAADYPLQVNLAFGVSGQQCVSNAGYVFCIGGLDTNNNPRSEVYSSSLISSSSTNITVWNGEASSYPVDIQAQSCISYSNYVYCVGGQYDDSQDDTASSYFTTVSNNGELGAWISTTAYPIPIDSQYCVASSGYIYCVGGVNETAVSGTNGTEGSESSSTVSNSVYFAPISSSGIGNWTLSVAYPSSIYYPSCYASGDYIYCLGGTNSANNVQNNVYFALLSSSGVGTWTQTKAYPVSLVGQYCVISSGYIYCVGGSENAQDTYTNAVYYAPVSSSGIGTWKSSASYPLGTETECATSSNYIYCVGGFIGSGESEYTYYAGLSALS